MNEEVKREFAELEEVGEGVQAVIVGDLGSAFGYDILNQAFSLRDGGGRVNRAAKEPVLAALRRPVLDVGPFVATIEYATSRQAYAVGKPAHGFFEQILEDLHVDAAAATMVNDDIESNIGWGAVRRASGDPRANGQVP